LPPPPPRMSCFIWIALILAHDKIRMYVEKFSHLKNISGRIIWRSCIQGLNGLCCHCRHLRFHHLYPPGVNFINVKRANFTYKCHFGSFFSSYLYVKKVAKMTFVRKMRWWNWRQVFISQTFLTCDCARSYSILFSYLDWWNGLAFCKSHGKNRFVEIAFSYPLRSRSASWKELRIQPRL